MPLPRFLMGWEKLGIKRSDLVLEVGSGNRPAARSDVLCDLGDSGQMARYGGDLLNDTVMDRPFVFGDAQQLPFRDGSFDYLIAAHVLEHLEQPDHFLNEACRVSKRGCIITPSETFEKIFVEPTHLSYISLVDGVLKIHAKEPDDQGPFGTLFRELWPRSRHLQGLIVAHPDVFEVCYLYRDGKINFETEGTISLPHKKAESDDDYVASSYIRRLLKLKVRSAVGRAVRLAASQGEVDFNELLACPLCNGDAVLEDNSVRCLGCGRQYPLRNDCMPVMLATEAR